MRTLLLLLCAAAVVAGCKSTRNEPYFGPTQTLEQVAEAINANNRPIQTVWARHDFDARIFDNRGKSHSLSGSGTLLFRRPGDLLLKASGIVDFFEAGANADVFWFTVYPKEVSTQWWGKRGSVQASESSQIPIRPDLLIEVLGVSMIDEDFLREPVPVMRFNNDADAYMIVWQAPTSSRWVAQKEVWFDRQTRRPALILLFNPQGRVIARSRLSKFQKIQGMSSEMATRYELFFPENKSQLAFTITDLRPYLEKEVGPRKVRVRYPNDATFQFPEDPGVEKRIQIK